MRRLGYFSVGILLEISVRVAEEVEVTGLQRTERCAVEEEEGEEVVWVML